MELTTTYDDTIDVEEGNRCKTFMRGIYKCIKGDYCDKLHRYPKEDNIMCRNFKEGCCQRTIEDCWFQHRPWQSNKRKKEEADYYLIEPMGHTMKRLRGEDKKRKDEELNESDQPEPSGSIQGAATKCGKECINAKYIENLNRCEMGGTMQFLCRNCESNKKYI